jgi:uncharacterized protein (TIGR00369 family)
MFDPPGECYKGQLDAFLRPDAKEMTVLGSQLTEWEPGGVEMEFSPSAEHVIGGTSNLTGRIHGDFVATFADLAMRFATWSVLQDGEAFASSGLHVQYFKPAIGVLKARARVERRGQRVAFCSSVVTDADQYEVATAIATEIEFPDQPRR